MGGKWKKNWEGAHLTLTGLNLLNLISAFRRKKEYNQNTVKGTSKKICWEEIFPPREPFHRSGAAPAFDAWFWKHPGAAGHGRSRYTKRQHKVRYMETKNRFGRHVFVFVFLWKKQPVGDRKFGERHPGVVFRPQM